jgi:hypothetical protein
VDLVGSRTRFERIYTIDINEDISIWTSVTQFCGCGDKTQFGNATNLERNRALTPRNTVGVVELPHSTTQYCTSLISDETRGETPKRAGNGMVKIDYRSIKSLGLGRAVRTVRSTRQ